MRSLKFPNMFASNSTNVWEESEFDKATKQNVKLLLNSERGELFGDPYYGILLKHYLFDQNNYILKDALIDVLYTQIAIFMPQLKVKRSEIEITQDREKGKLYCTFIARNQIDFTIDTYNLVLFDSVKTTNM